MSAATTLELSRTKPVAETAKAEQPKAISRYTQIPSNKLVRWENGIVLSHECKQHLWKVAAVATLVGFIALAVAATLLTQIYAPTYFPLALIAVFPCAEVAYQQYAYFSARSADQAGLAKIEKEVLAHYTYYNGMYTSDKGITLAKELAQDGITIKGDAQPLLPVIARYEVLKKHAKHLSEQAQEQIAALRTAEEPNFREVKETGERVAFLRAQSLLTKVQAAYLRGLLCNPSWTKDWNEMCTLYFIPEGDRRLAEIARHPSADKLLVFKEKGKDEITRTALAEMSVADLSTKLFA